MPGVARHVFCIQYDVRYNATITTRVWPSGKAKASQAFIRGFESRNPLQVISRQRNISVAVCHFEDVEELKPMRWKCVKQDASASELVSPFVQGNYRRQKPP